MDGWILLHVEEVIFKYYRQTRLVWLNTLFVIFPRGSGVDVPELMRTIHISEAIVAKMENTPTGHLAIAYLCYKLATPVRYMLTIGKSLCLKYSNALNGNEVLFDRRNNCLHQLPIAMGLHQTDADQATHEGNV